MVVQDGGGAVQELFGHGRSRTIPCGRVVLVRRIIMRACCLRRSVSAVRAADDEADVFAVLLPGFEVFRQLDGGRCFAAFVKDDEERALRYGFASSTRGCSFFFLLPLHLGVHSLPVLCFSEFAFFEYVGDVALGVFGDHSGESGHHQASSLRPWLSVCPIFLSIVLFMGFRSNT